MEITQLKQFKTVAECENISKAAEALYISQPSLTRAIQNLEMELGYVLFERTGKKIHLNDNGLIVLKHVNEALKSLDGIEQDLKDNAARRVLRIYSSVHGISFFLIPEIFSKSSIKVDSQIVDQQYIDKLLIGKKCDIAFSVAPIKAKGIVSKLLCYDYPGITVPNKMNIHSKNTVTLTDIVNYPFVTYQTSNPLQVECRNRLKDNGVHFDIQVNQIALEKYVKTRDCLTMASLFSKYVGSTIFDFRDFIPFDKSKNMKMPYYMNYWENAEKIDDIKSIEKRLMKFLDEYNNEWCDF